MSRRKFRDLQDAREMLVEAIERNGTITVKYSDCSREHDSFLSSIDRGILSLWIGTADMDFDEMDQPGLLKMIEATRYERAPLDVSVFGYDSKGRICEEYYDRLKSKVNQILSRNPTSAELAWCSAWHEVMESIIPEAVADPQLSANLRTKCEHRMLWRFRPKLNS